MFYDLKVTCGNLEFCYHEDLYGATFSPLVYTILGYYCFPYFMDKSITTDNTIITEAIYVTQIPIIKARQLEGSQSTTRPSLGYPFPL